MQVLKESDNLVKTDKSFNCIEAEIKETNEVEPEKEGQIDKKPNKIKHMNKVRKDPTQPINNKEIARFRAIDKNMKKSDLRASANISTGTLAKLGKNESVTTDVLVRVCHTLDCDIGDIMEVLPDNNT